MVLQGLPSEECHRKLLEALKLYKTFGGKFPMCLTRASNRDLMQYLNKSFKHRRHFNGIKLKIKKLISNPLSLCEISRLVIRNCISKNYVESIEKLEVPVDLQSFLRFNDVTITELSTDFEAYFDGPFSIFQ